ncbi:MAG: PepA [Devosia sp.]|nr:PepA [Devosia sp.]
MIEIETTEAPATGTGTLVVYARQNEALAGTGAAFWATTGLDWDAVTRTAGFKGKPGNVLDILAPTGITANRLLVLGAGKAPDVTLPTPMNAWTDRGGSLFGKLEAAKATVVDVVLDMAEATPEAIGELAAGLRLRAYKFDRYKAKKPDEDEVAPMRITLHVADKAAADLAIADRGAVAEGTLLARELINEPPNVMGTLELAARAEALAELGVEIETLDEAQMTALGMNALLCVARGSRQPPRLVIMRWNGAAADEQPLAFVGKGVVFDTGGISIKPGLNMEDMKGDMGGSAAVIGLMHALARRKAKVNAIGVVGIVENMPDGNAVRPGDIIRAMSGTTIEIVNTDAEGRLVLADALWYTQDRFKPRLMVDLATLTGAIVVALGVDQAGLFSNRDELATQLLAAGIKANEKLWHMPMGPAYAKIIESRFADIKNSGGRHAGSVTAAQFLARFHNDVPWAHLDIAGVAFGNPANEINTSWGAGFGVALLDRFVRDNFETPS